MIRYNILDNDGIEGYGTLPINCWAFSEFTVCWCLDPDGFEQNLGSGTVSILRDSQLAIIPGILRLYVFWPRDHHSRSAYLNFA